MIGAQGFQGAQGALGPVGRQGVIGAQGFQGAQGRAGNTGPQGLVGAQGFQGAQGAQGAQGHVSAIPTQVAALGINTTAGATGTILATGDIVSNYSDARLKEILYPVTNALNMIDAIEGVYFEPNELAQSLGFEKKRNIGLIAQNVRKILPEVVKIAPFDMNKHGHSKSGENYMTIMYSKIVPLLIQALKEQKNQIEYIRNNL